MNIKISDSILIYSESVVQWSAQLRREETANWAGIFHLKGFFFRGVPSCCWGIFFKSIFPGAVFGDSVEAITVIRGWMPFNYNKWRVNRYIMWNVTIEWIPSFALSNFVKVYNTKYNIVADYFLDSYEFSTTSITEGYDISLLVNVPPTCRYVIYFSFFKSYKIVQHSHWNRSGLHGNWSMRSVVWTVRSSNSHFFWLSEESSHFSFDTLCFDIVSTVFCLCFHIASYQPEIISLGNEDTSATARKIVIPVISVRYSTALPLLGIYNTFTKNCIRLSTGMLPLWISIYLFFVHIIEPIL